MADVSPIPGLTEPWRQTPGDPRIRAAIVDGPVDTGHPALATALLAPEPTLDPAPATVPPGPVRMRLSGRRP